MSHADILTARSVRALMRQGLDTKDIAWEANLHPERFPALPMPRHNKGKQLPFREADIYNALCRDGIRLVKSDAA